MQLQQGIHPVQSEDLPQVVEVWEASVRATHDFLSEADIQFLKPLVGGELLALEDLACVRDRDGAVVGFVGVDKDKLEALFIHPDWRGTGLGRRLVDYAVARGATTVDVNEQNHQAVGFYLRMGFAVERRSEVDGLGKPFPLLHMRLQGGR